MSQVEAVTDPLEARIRLMAVVVAAFVPVELALLYFALDGFTPIMLAAVVGTATLTIAIILYIRQRELKRRAALAEQARRLGMQFQPAATGQVLEGFELYRQGVRRNVLFGERGDTDVEVFGYACPSGSGERGGAAEQTVLLLRRPDLDLPAFRLRARAFLDGVFSDGGISFADTPEFTSEYHLGGQDECRVGRLFDRSLRSWLAGNPGLWIEGRGNQVLVCRLGRRVAPADLRAFIDEGMRVADRLARG